MQKENTAISKLNNEKKEVLRDENKEAVNDENKKAVNDENEEPVIDESNDTTSDRDYSHERNKRRMTMMELSSDSEINPAHTQGIVGRNEINEMDQNSISKDEELVSDASSYVEEVFHRRKSKKMAMSSDSENEEVEVESNSVEILNQHEDIGHRVE